MSDQNLRGKQATLLSFVKKILKDEQQNSQEVKEDSRSTANGLPQHEKVLDDDIQEKMKLRYPTTLGTVLFQKHING
ncbi:hypothetical protein TNCV_5077071 [Trichonephila clavipes]|uniref:Uncharacterized protein n=1 Tax=Trichonephila clavipes TaxID=2585209 RepID=A0A8X6RYQ4_TRICX|nr:hypothetical protein TNCV_5077071 [Trichonephila clavipes]